MTEIDQEPVDAIPVLARGVRIALVLIALGIVAVFGMAWWLDPYKGGKVWRMETHTQLGLPPCTFKTLTGLPCPSCGMTTSFALFIRGDVVNSLRANFVGTLLAAFCLVLVPWSLASAWLRRPLFVVTIEPVLIRVIVVFLIVLLLRWAVVLTWIWWAHARAS
jgi:Protein of unknown function (DUF2752)